MRVELRARTFFRYATPVGRRPARLRVDGRISEWGAEHLLPDLTELEGGQGFAQVHLGWDEAGLYFGLRVTRKTHVVSQRQNPRAGDGLLLWIDTRDVRDAHRASRYCHHFIALPRGGGANRSRATAWQAHIHRAREQAPICEPGVLRVASDVAGDSYGLELAVPARALHGYDPEQWPRLGFQYLVCDHEHGWQTWVSQPGLPFDWDPSLWGTVELVP